MGIPVTCPAGHSFKVKEKYAGKRGRCPFCRERIEVPDPGKLTDEDIADMMGEPPASSLPATSSSSDPASIFDDSQDDSSALSLLEASAIRQMKKCRFCGERIPFWSKHCPHCDSEL